MSPQTSAPLSQSTSTLTISWRPPVMAEERWEFCHHPDKQPFYQRHALDWERLLSVAGDGRLTAWPRGPLLGALPVALAYSSYDDYLTYLVQAPRNYRLGYRRMEQALQRDGHLTLPAPIVLACDGEALLFAGWRRLCLAWNHGLTPFVWLVDI